MRSGLVDSISGTGGEALVDLKKHVSGNKRVVALSGTNYLANGSSLLINLIYVP
jgi:hypothetical protein